MQITKDHIKQFRLIKKAYFHQTDVPEPDNWKTLSNNKIWLDLIGQVMVVGSADSAVRFHDDPQLKKRVAFNKLAQIEDKKEIAKEINYVLRATGTRYASQSISKCRKTAALLHNFKVLKTYKKGAKGILERISEFQGPNSTKRKVKYLMKIFYYIKSKSARDFLMQKGLITDAIALDIRIQNILKSAGISVPKGFENDPELYDAIERKLLNDLCKPLRLKGIEFDRMLFQNYDQIREDR